MGYDVDFLPVGDGEKGGDAIAVRWGNLNGNRTEQKVMVIDGGTKDSGNALVKHIKEYYKTDFVDYVFCTHPDADHASGLTVVLEELKVGILCMHRPWEHAADIKNLFQNGKITATSLRENLRKALENAHELESIATKKGIKIFEPFSDSVTNSNSPLTILGPSEEFYQLMLANFRETPKPKDNVNILGRSAILTAVREAIRWIGETWGVETLADPEEFETSAENNSSVILLLQVDGNKLLFTGDAGVESLDAAINKAITLGIDLTGISFIQIPHHGSKHNVSPSLLDKLVGPKLTNDISNKTAFVSVPLKGDPKHPSRKVTNAFKRRGAKVIATKESTKHHFKDAPDRGWVKAEPLPFYDQVAD